MGFSAESRTVIDLTEHLSRLKSRAQEMSAHFSASERGYFTPSEEDDALHLLVSYWQTRNALFELIHSLGRRDEGPEGWPTDAFVIAYAAALTLVDAARFIHETFDDRSVIRKKLNEGAPLFGIPPGFYDSVQRSLTKLTNSWRLYHATQFYRDNQAALKKRLEPELKPVFAIIDNLILRVHVSWQQYVKAKLKTKARQALSTVRRDAVGQAIYTVQELASRMVSHVTLNPSHEPGLPAARIAEFREIMQPGDVLVTRRDFALTNYFLPGYWPHAALYMGRMAELESMQLQNHESVRTRWERLAGLDKNEDGRVLEALKDGVWLRTVHSPFGADALAIIRPKLAREEVATALARGVSHDGKAYDFDFDFTRSDRMVCTEVVYRSYEGVGKVKFKLTRRAGRMTLTAEDLLHMALRGEHFEPCALYVPNETARVVTGSEVNRLLEKTMGESG
ncbi:MAG: YiiX/YebB-like N1pC/P60 family cysteine hydrolase [Planctomycetota bacterium]|nr:YiiX/YebB-like N1pC/P60 family cysteine hydrolase [Planctomycetota bacterium]MDA1140622.1 YiiX/YebB-like N1pC/P60 family cysteine hydrolase [Planctomycetota bacterium]